VEPELLAEDAIPASDPFGLFDDWLEEAKSSEINDPTAMALATVSAGGAPSVRMVLLKGHGPDLGQGGGFVFYTNRESRKADEIAANPQAALLFHWKSLRRQIRIEGQLEPVSDADADAYFATRARDSQLGAHASDQSAPMGDRREFLDRFEEVRKRYEGKPVPRPAYWGGYRLVPQAMEFWHDRPFRLHERRRFTRRAGSWASTLLYP